MKRFERVIHCWKGKYEYMCELYGKNSEEAAEAFWNDGTCLLPEGHEGEHEFTPDREIKITFACEKVEE